MEQSNRDYVILVHGLGRTAKSMQGLAGSLSDIGYESLNINYPSRSDTIENLSQEYILAAVKQFCGDTRRKIHFVTHSMGGMMVRYFLSQNQLPNLGRVVMLAPPNQGSKYADRWSKLPLSSLIFGQALAQMTSDTNSMPNTLPEPDYEVGVIAGQKDGKVTIEQTKLSKMSDFLIVSEKHTFIMNSNKVIEATDNFFKEGKF